MLDIFLMSFRAPYQSTGQASREIRRRRPERSEGSLGYLSLLSRQGFLLLVEMTKPVVISSESEKSCSP